MKTLIKIEEEYTFHGNSVIVTSKKVYLFGKLIYSTERKAQ